MQVKLKHLRNFFFGLPLLYLAKTVCIPRKDYLFTTDRLSNRANLYEKPGEFASRQKRLGIQKTKLQDKWFCLLLIFSENDGGWRHPVDNKTNSSSLFVHFSPKEEQEVYLSHLIPMFTIDKKVYLSAPAAIILLWLYNQQTLMWRVNFASFTKLLLSIIYIHKKSGWAV